MNKQPIDDFCLAGIIPFLLEFGTFDEQQSLNGIMCLILFSFDDSSETPLIVAANRDEFFKRPSASAHFWEEAPAVFAGRDLVAHGTWMGVTQSGRFAAVTNVREPDIVVDNALSRGDLTRHFLTGNLHAEEYLHSIEPEKMRYSGFNLLVGEISNHRCELFYSSNRRAGIHRLDNGVYGLSNHLLDSPWPKVKAGKDFLQSCLSPADTQTLHQQLRSHLENPALAEDGHLPSTGVSYEREKALSAAFITLPDYGTRTSTVITIDKQHISFSEKHYVDAGSEVDFFTFPLV